MGMNWQEPWTEIWSSGHGPERTYCGIADTDDGYAVDLFEGDTCVASSLFQNRADAEQAAQRMRARYLPTAAHNAGRAAVQRSALTH
jgi:hypothetical protein